MCQAIQKENKNLRQSLQPPKTAQQIKEAFHNWGRSHVSSVHCSIDVHQEFQEIPLKCNNMKTLNRISFGKREEILFAQGQKCCNGHESLGSLVETLITKQQCVFCRLVDSTAFTSPHHVGRWTVTAYITLVDGLLQEPNSNVYQVSGRCTKQT